MKRKGTNPSFPQIHSISRGCSDADNGSLERAPNGRALCLPTSKLDNLGLLAGKYPGLAADLHVIAASAQLKSRSVDGTLTCRGARGLGEQP